MACLSFYYNFPITVLWRYPYTFLIMCFCLFLWEVGFWLSYELECRYHLAYERLWLVHLEQFAVNVIRSLFIIRVWVTDLLGQWGFLCWKFMAYMVAVVWVSCAFQVYLPWNIYYMYRAHRCNISVYLISKMEIICWKDIGHVLLNAGRTKEKLWNM